MVRNRILLAGEGGQGVQTMAKIFTEAYHDSGEHVTFLPNFGVEQRGGVSLAFVQVSDEEGADFPKFEKADIVVLLTERGLKRIERYLDHNTILLFDNSLIKEGSLSGIKVEKVAVPASYLAKEKLIPRVFNVIILGALNAEIGRVKGKYFKKSLTEYFEEKIKKDPELRHFNQKAFELGENIIKSLKGKHRGRNKI